VAATYCSRRQEIRLSVEKDQAKTSYFLLDVGRGIQIFDGRWIYFQAEAGLIYV
jgi:hypothetical protein